MVGDDIDMLVVVSRPCPDLLAHSRICLDTPTSKSACPTNTLASHLQSADLAVLLDRRCVYMDTLAVVPVPFLPVCS
ncbi:hypothetical protein M404DRAFT_864120 [Pisolithus tinctorius Marx 270]|uniref:Uncharacterized protein n=1 Tax=Pisolithus tinctorius Marx 270 TaxID=870435 RepID=A0A0C3NAK3_PISTI|nr:hypothetical protein M404DRAFT_864120 [Pisolithus tinctorius Marx 270]